MPTTLCANSILPTVRVPMSERQRHAMERLDAENFVGVVRLTRKELAKQGVEFSDDYCSRAITGLKQYYALTIFDPRNMHAVSDVLDPFWHAHILDTVRYQMLCEALGGFMHHDPLDTEDREKVSAVGRVYEYTYSTLCRIFGEDNLDEEFHPSTLPEASLVCRHDIDDDVAATYSDVFPEVPELAGLRARYGHNAQRIMIADELAA